MKRAYAEPGRPIKTLLHVRQRLANEYRCTGRTAKSKALMHKVEADLGRVELSAGGRRSLRRDYARCLRAVGKATEAETLLRAQIDAQGLTEQLCKMIRIEIACCQIAAGK